MGWAWITGTPIERANMVRAHNSLTDEQLREVFHLTEPGLDAIRGGDRWRSEYEENMGGMKDTLGDTPYILPTPAPAKAFDGQTYEPARDHPRLKGQLGKVHELMKDHEWRTLFQIVGVVGGTEAAVSARLRDLRKSRYGTHTIERQHVGSGLYRYRIKP